MPQAINWNDVAYEMAPISQYTDLYSNQPRIYMFEGASIIDLVFLLVSTVLTLFWLFYLIQSESSLTKSLMTITVTQIFVNDLVRIFKTGVLIFIPYPQFSWLFVASSVETTFHYTLYLQYTSSVLLYVLLREKDMKSSWTLFYYIPSIGVALFVSALNVNFNKLLLSMPFYVYVIVYVGMTVSNVVILIGILASCAKYTREKLAIRCRLFLFVFTASPPVLFNTVITIMDLLFMVVGITDQFPIPYIVMTTYRYKAFEVTPVFILIAFFALLPDLKKWSSMKMTTTAEVTAIVTEPPSASSSSTVIIPKAMDHPLPLPSVPIPNQIDLVDNLQNETRTAPMPTYGNLNYGMGALVVHIQPLSNS